MGVVVILADGLRQVESPVQASAARAYRAVLNVNAISPWELGFGARLRHAYACIIILYAYRPGGSYPPIHKVAMLVSNPDPNPNLPRG